MARRRKRVRRVSKVQAAIFLLGLAVVLCLKSQGYKGEDKAKGDIGHRAQGDIELPEELELPICAGAKGARDHEIRYLDGFTLCYRESYEEPEWVAYELTSAELESVTSRKDNFRADPMISTGSSTPEDYRDSGFDRGHLAPAGDFTYSAESMDDTFYMSNMTPQVPSFNRGIWKKLEEKVREIAGKYGAVFVVTGPLLEESASSYEVIGDNAVVVPKYFYKVLLVINAKGALSGIGFIIPNAPATKGLKDYAVPIDEVERRAKLDFFSLLDDSVEDAVEESVNYSDWF